MEPKELISNLIEASGQIEAAVIVTRGGDFVASIGTEAASTSLADIVCRLSAEASGIESPTGESFVQLQVMLDNGCVFLAQDDHHAVGCVTVRQPTAGLVFYDLKVMLSRLSGDEKSFVPKPQPWDDMQTPGLEGQHD